MPLSNARFIQNRKIFLYFRARKESLMVFPSSESGNQSFNNRSHFKHDKCFSSVDSQTFLKCNVVVPENISVTRQKRLKSERA